VGKTYVSTALVRGARALGHNAVGFKPICCGDRDDAEQLWAASGGDAVVPVNTVNPVWFRTPAAPYTAAIIENRHVDLALIRETATALTAEHAHVIAEGAGGWAVPIEQGLDFGDLAREFGWPVLVVAGNRLGALNHVLLTVRAIEASGLVCSGVILNAPPGTDTASPIALATNRGVLETLLRCPVWPLGLGEAPDEICRAVVREWSDSRHVTQHA
jgi:dethiobiotin synthetase